MTPEIREQLLSIDEQFVGDSAQSLRLIEHRIINGVPVIEAMESESVTPAGEVRSRTTCRNVHVECVEP